MHGCRRLLDFRAGERFGRFDGFMMFGAAVDARVTQVEVGAFFGVVVGVFRGEVGEGGCARVVGCGHGCRLILRMACLEANSERGEVK